MDENVPFVSLLILSLLTYFIVFNRMLYHKKNLEIVDLQFMGPLWFIVEPSVRLCDLEPSLCSLGHVRLWPCSPKHFYICFCWATESGQNFYVNSFNDRSIALFWPLQALHAHGTQIIHAGKTPRYVKKKFF